MDSGGSPWKVEVERVRRLRGFDHLKVIAAPAPEQNATSFRLPGTALPVTHRHLRYGFVEDH